jgi:hypothetical protein
MECTIKVRPSKFLTLEMATYNCPWANTGVRNNTPILLNVWPWDLLIVIAKAKRNGNWYLSIRWLSLTPGINRTLLNENSWSFLGPERIAQRI